MDFLTRKYGPLPGWAWGAVAAGAALLFFYMRSRQSSSSPAASANTLAASPAASAIPFVPSVTVTGIPNAQPATPSTSSGSGLTATVRDGPVPGRDDNNRSGVPVMSSPTGGQVVSYQQFNSQVSLGGPPVGGTWGPAPAQFYPLASGIGFILAQDLVNVHQGSGGGRGGWGMAGQENPVAMMGWTAGWQPATPGPGSRPGGLGGGASSQTMGSHRARTTRVRGRGARAKR